MGMAEACTALDFPVVSGNVSLYNETDGRPILPTPDHRRASASSTTSPMPSARGSRRPAMAIVLIGETAGWLGQSLYLREIAAAARKARRRRSTLRSSAATATSCAARSSAGRIAACHDLSDGGLLVGLAEMAWPAAPASR